MVLYKPQKFLLQWPCNIKLREQSYCIMCQCNEISFALPRQKDLPCHPNRRTGANMHALCLFVYAIRMVILGNIFKSWCPFSLCICLFFFEILLSVVKYVCSTELKWLMLIFQHRYETLSVVLTSLVVQLKSRDQFTVRVSHSIASVYQGKVHKKSQWYLAKNWGWASNLQNFFIIVFFFKSRLISDLRISKLMQPKEEDFLAVGGRPIKIHNDSLYWKK